VHLDAADTIAFNNRHPDIATLTPAGAPGVLYDPVFDTSRVNSIADSKNCVIVLIAASWIGKHTTRVAFENSWRIKVDRQRSFRKGCLHLLNVSWLHGRPVSNKNTRVGGRVIGASSVDTNVRVLSLSFNEARLEILISKEWVSATASVILGIAVNQLLLRESKEVARRYKVCAFKSSSRGKCPARATAALILNWSNGASSDPINGRWELIGWVLDDRGFRLAVTNFVAKQLFVFSLSPITEMVNAEGVSPLFVVVLTDEVSSVLEKFCTARKLCHILVRFSILSDEPDEVNIVCLNSESCLG